MKKFNITFTENKKYNPAKRTVMVEANDEFHAKTVFASEFDSFKYDKNLMVTVPSGKRVTINKISEIKEKEKKEV